MKNAFGDYRYDLIMNMRKKNLQPPELEELSHREILLVDFQLVELGSWIMQRGGCGGRTKYGAGLQSRGPKAKNFCRTDGL